MHPTKESGRPPLEADATPIGRDWVEYANELEAKRDALVLVAEAVVNGEWEAARELADAALERHP